MYPIHILQLLKSPIKKVHTRSAKVVMQCWVVREKLGIELSKIDVFLFPM